MTGAKPAECPTLEPLEMESSLILQERPKRRNARGASNVHGRRKSWRGIEKRSGRRRSERRKNMTIEESRRKERVTSTTAEDKNDDYRRDERSDRDWDCNCYRSSRDGSSHRHCDLSESRSGSESEGWTKVSHRKDKHKSKSH